MNDPEDDSGVHYMPNRIHVRCPSYDGNAGKHANAYVEPEGRFYSDVLESIRSGRTAYACHCGQRLKLVDNEASK